MQLSTSTCGIYRIRRLDKDQCYVGQAVNIRKRWVTHRQDLKNNRHSSKFLQRVYNKHGLECFVFEILERDMDPTDGAALTSAEQRWVDILNPCYNSAPVAGSLLGFKKSAATKEKHRLAMLGNKNNVGNPSSFLGRTHTEEAKRKNAEAHMGKPSKLKGIPRSAEVRAKVSASKRGVPSERKGIPSGKKGVPWTAVRRAAFEKSKSKHNAEIGSP